MTSNQNDNDFLDPNDIISISDDLEGNQNQVSLPVHMKR